MFQIDDEAVTAIKIGFVADGLAARLDAHAQAAGSVFGAGQRDHVAEREQVAGAVDRQVAGVELIAAAEGGAPKSAGEAEREPVAELQ